MTHDDFLDSNTAERLLSGAVPAADAHPDTDQLRRCSPQPARPGPCPRWTSKNSPESRAVRRTIPDRPQLGGPPCSENC